MASAAVVEGAAATPPHALPTMDSFNCPVCLDLLVQPVCASCGHDFCKFCYEAWVSESGNTVDSPACPVCRQDISAVCPGVCRRMEATISVLFPEKLVARVAEVELHKRQHAEMQSERNAQHAQALHRLYNRILTMISSLRSPSERQQGEDGPERGHDSQEPQTDGNASDGNANASEEHDTDAMDASALARTLDSFMNTAVSSNAWQDGPPLLTLVFTIGRNGEPGPPRNGPPRQGDNTSRRSPRFSNSSAFRRRFGQQPSEPPAQRRQSARLRGRRAREGPPPPQEGPDRS